MLQEPGDRGRLALAVVLTVAALPFLWSSKREQSGAESVAAIAPTGAVVGESAPAGFTAEPAAQVIDSLTVTASPLDPAVDDGVVTIDVAAPSSGEGASGTARYRHWPEDLTDEERPCGSPLAPFGKRIVVTNTDNGYKVACKNVSTKPLADDAVILLDTDVFLELADLGDAPIPVEISW